MEKLRRLAFEAQDEAHWDKLFAHGEGLEAAAQKAQQEIAAGHASDMDFNKL